MNIATTSLLDALRNHGNGLRGLKLAGENLDGADFSGLNLDGANFSGASLRNARFSRATLRSATFDGAVVDGASFDHAVLDDCAACGVNFTGANLGMSRWLNARLDGSEFCDDTNLTYADFRFASMTRVIVRQAKAKCVTLWGATLTGAQFLGGSAHYWDLRVGSSEGAAWVDFTFADCALGTELCSADLSRTQFFTNGAYSDPANLIVHVYALATRMLPYGLQFVPHNSDDTLAVLKLPLSADVEPLRSLAAILGSKVVTGYKNHVLVVSRNYLHSSLL